MTEAEVLVTDRGHVRWLTLNRPEAMNAITGDMLGQLNDALKAADDDPNVRVVVVTGAGRAFCAGLDLKQAARGEGIGGAGLASAGARHYGLDLALGCDMRIMSDRAILMPGFARMGVVPESGGTWYLPRLLGWAKACEVAMLGDTLTAEQSAGYGLVNKVVPADAFEAEVTAWAEKIASNAPLAIAEIKRLFRHALTQDFESHSHHVLMSVLNLFRSEDFREGVRSFTEKRPPQFQGR
jgi:enoyl-CoA hydratase/carnithine racemase